MYFLIFLSTLIARSALEDVEESRVYNGNDLDPIDQGYLVLLHILSEDDAKTRCSGSIISSRWILTAAHCLTVEKPIAMIFVEQNTNELNRTLAKVTPNDTFAHPKYIHGNYTYANTQYDIALLKTTKEIKLDDYARSIEPAKKFSPRNNQSAVLSGYGLNELGKLLPRQGVVRVTKCPFAHSRRLLCSNSKVKSGGGDSGGALTSNGKLVGVILGISKTNCEETNPESPCTSVYANVATHYKWIREVRC